MSDQGGEPGKTLPMGVDDMAFLVDRLGRDAAPFQFLRELTHNGIQAILETDSKTGEVRWDNDWHMHDLTSGKQNKLTCIDSGTGMTGDQQVQHINNLSSSGRVQARGENYGIGAKLAGLARSPEGLIYQSWVDDNGTMTHLWRDPSTGEYGLAPLQEGDSFVPYAAISDDVRPNDIIGRHGTKVVLLGKSPDENTVEPPADYVGGRERWITKYLNTRYMRFPKGITVNVREGYQNPRSDTKRNFLRRVTGMEEFLSKEAESQGQAQLSGATAHWWILSDRAERSKVSDMINTNGHAAALYDDELYEVLTSRAGTARLQQFGVIFGSARVVIYVEPDSGPHVDTNTARTQLLINKEPLPWSQWAAEFREDMPQAIKDLMDQVAAGSASTSHRDGIRDRLKRIKDLFRMSRYRKTPSGASEVAGDVAGGKPASGQSAGVLPSSPGGRGGRAGGVYALFLEPGGSPGEATAADPMPITKWISVDDGTRTVGDLEDRAAKYLVEQNLLMINADFRVFTDMIDRWCDRYSGTPAARGVITDVVHEWFEQALVETVMAAQQLVGEPQWTLDEVGGLWSEESLTAVALQRWHIDVNVKRALGAKLGQAEEERSEAA